MTAFSHIPVLFEETVDGLAVKPGGTYVDCTLGGGGHAGLCASRLGEGGRLIALDQDEEAIGFARERLAKYGEKITFVKENFVRVGAVLDELSPAGIDGAMIDLGVSSHQLDTPERGFSYHADARIDMRMDQSASLSGYEVVNGYEMQELARILRDYGEEKRAGQIARAICGDREKKPIETTFELAELIKSVFPEKERFEGKHPARRTFQAIRIEVNHELDIIPDTIHQLVSRLRPGGRLCIITFHSLEDRAVKETVKSYIEGCTCPRDFPVCVCGFRPSLKLIARKPVTASKKELDLNPRSRSAKLRIAEKL